MNGRGTDAVSGGLERRLAAYRAKERATWEKRAQGWLHWGMPVPLEPPLGSAADRRPASAEPSSPKQGASQADADGRGVGRRWFRSLSDSIRGRTMPAPDAMEPKVELFPDDQPLVEWQVSLPPDVPVSPERCAQAFLSLKYCAHPLGFEVVGDRDSISVVLVCREQDRDHLVQQVSAHVPEAALTALDRHLEGLWGEPGHAESVIKEFGLAREFLFPLRTIDAQHLDPLIGTVAALESLDEGEVGLLQVLFQPARSPWANAIQRAVADSESRVRAPDASSRRQHALKKIAHPLYAAVIRVAAKSASHERAQQIARALGGSLASFADPGSNELRPLSTDRDVQREHEEDVLLRRSRRSGMLLNTEELVSLVHLPFPSVRSAKLVREHKRTKAAPAIAAGHSLVLGENIHAGASTPVTLNPEQRTQHLHVIGASGTGKSTFLLNLIRQDIENGGGLAVLDPHGDLIEQVLAHVPEARHADVVYFDPSDDQYPIGFNILSAHTELEKTLLASDLVAVFRRFSTSWGDQMTSVLGNAILAFLESSQGGTLADLRRFLVDAQFRHGVLRTVQDQEVVYYWQWEFPLLAGKPQAPLLTRLDTFLRPKLIRRIVSQKDNRLDIGAIMNGGKILLAKLAQGAIGEENAYLLGSLLVSKFHQLALSRQQVEAAERRNFSLYVDEFHHFITPSMAAILSGARKYRLGLILAHQDMGQLSGRDADMTSAVLSNAYTRVCFRVGDNDARKLAEGFSFFEARDLQNLGTGEAIGRMERAEYDFNLKTPPLPAVDAARAARSKEAIIAISRQRYATPRETVEADLARQYTSPAPVQSKQVAAPGVAPLARASAAGALPQAVPGEPAAGVQRPASPPATRTPRRIAGGRLTLPEPAPPPADQAIASPQPEVVPQEPLHTAEAIPQESAQQPEALPQEPVQPAAPPARSPSKSPAPRPPPRVPAEPPSPGRGGPQHKYLQELIKRSGEEFGYRATIEKPILEGKGSVDVALEKDGRSIAFEISVTSTVDQELGNVVKCLDAKFDHVVLVSTDPKHLAKIEALVAETVKVEERAKVRYLRPEDMLPFLETLEVEGASREETVRGYKVKVNYKPVADEDKQARKHAISQVILAALRRLKG